MVGRARRPWVRVGCLSIAGGFMIRCSAIALRMVAVLGIGIAMQETQGGIGTKRADGPEYWRSHSVVFATIVDVYEPEWPTSAFISGRPVHIVKLQPVVTVAGSFDATLEPELTLRVETYGWSKWVSVVIEPRALAAIQLPSVNSRVIVVLEKIGGLYEISPDRAEFMPSEEPLCEVDGLSDPVVTGIRMALQKLRADTAFRARLRPEFKTMSNTSDDPFIEHSLLRQSRAEDPADAEFTLCPFVIPRLQTDLFSDNGDQESQDSASAPRYPAEAITD